MSIVFLKKDVNFYIDLSIAHGFPFITFKIFSMGLNNPTLNESRVSELPSLIHIKYI